ncbi:hypothetical protein H0H81_003174 [Sphagnurus paluster]|uniref:Uncharacterized protein n=1 Tax=Sphagnurus paluster TaxID=117069 RepID=A0A9P7FP47_9AGAR|nr:hypothetical protein H0H81_003174 [Sphagnurus paluster]
MGCNNLVYCQFCDKYITQSRELAHRAAATKPYAETTAPSREYRLRVIDCLPGEDLQAATVAHPSSSIPFEDPLPGPSELPIPGEHLTNFGDEEQDPQLQHPNRHAWVEDDKEDEEDTSES